MDGSDTMRFNLLSCVRVCVHVFVMPEGVLLGYLTLYFLASTRHHNFPQ